LLIKDILNLKWAMVGIENLTGLSSGIDWSEVIMGVPGLGGLVAIGKAVGIVVIVYISFLIIRSIVQIKYSLRFKRLTQNVEDINRKMDILISQKSRKEKPSEKDVKKKGWFARLFSWKK